MDESQTVHIAGQFYRYTSCPEDGTYLFDVNGAGYRFRQWTWGEKNLVVDASTVADPANGRLRVDIARFNELMLATSLVEAPAIGSINVMALRRLNPVLGDTLLSMAYWVNELPASQKKA